MFYDEALTEEEKEYYEESLIENTGCCEALEIFWIKSSMELLVEDYTAKHHSYDDYKQGVEWLYNNWEQYRRSHTLGKGVCAVAEAFRKFLVEELKKTDMLDLANELGRY